MSNMSDRLSNAANSTIGGAKQAIGETIGNPNLAASGAAQKTQADTAQAAAQAKTHAEGLGDQIKGRAQQVVGSATGDRELQTKGHANEFEGDIERIV
ncbi:hypothetical protein BX616_009906 [Lobosporangium transversale]|uniref:CsbD-like domain-containing protein n=1 Tax=Lobosporangium transversale TaxID=64571 RepID=A0A1Y2GS76_9FUNG|nr:hypothetical protein BCR41DRAFT_352212 [Lobosporangium transversale]KAF9913533.1 hypothetical protein BX616_009906 [Lobosporangium transversale]ORZ18335.1 hypothetical protein BCR41DRAFT_352212 [Lobosporangium transversale]|eukprot:XP_021882130.1 hypothetical protein BCR41DRAFT_352212 [Lobosporangium transversale]